jgi:hypothetical protein
LTIEVLAAKDLGQIISDSCNRTGDALNNYIAVTKAVSQQQKENARRAISKAASQTLLDMG